MSDRSEHTRDLDKESMCLTAKDKPQPISMVWYVGNNFQILNSQDVQKYPFKIKKKKLRSLPPFIVGKEIQYLGYRGLYIPYLGKLLPKLPSLCGSRTRKQVPAAVGASLLLRLSDLARPCDTGGE